MEQEHKAQKREEEKENSRNMVPSQNGKDKGNAAKEIRGEEENKIGWRHKLMEEGCE